MDRGFAQKIIFIAHKKKTGCRNGTGLFLDIIPVH
jgi:hypothetical protein